MNDEVKTKAQLIDELIQLRQRVAELEAMETQRNLAEKPPGESAEELKQPNVEIGLVEAEEAERRRLARELHDQVGQSLTAMGLNLDIIRALLPADIPEEIMARLDDTRALVTRTTKRVRQVMVELRPETLDDYGLLAALHWSAERFTQRTGIVVAVEGEEAESRLPPQVENVLYRVAQEALTNIAKHAQATQVNVSLKVDSETIYLIVADNGVGFTPGRPAALDAGPHWGLTLMAERVEGVNGRFRVESGPRQGTRIMVEVPR
jgi:two-component system sensor histidine kinase UhpB